MPSSKFECPRCQTVFVKDIGGDAAFVECPSCGALALPAGEANEGALGRALSGPQDAPPPGSLASTESEQPPAPSDPSAPAPGMFSGLLQQSDPGGAPVLDLPMAAMTPLPPPPPPMLAPISGSARAPELDFNFGNDLEIDLPSLPSFPAPPTTRSTEGRAIDDDYPVIPGAPVHTLPPDAMAALAAESDNEPTDARPKQAPWSGLSEDAFGDLEKAFDEMALKPGSAGSQRGDLSADEARFLRGDPGPSRAPPLRGVDGERTGRNSAPPRPPPRGGGRGAKEKRPRPTHFELSEEAKSLAFISLKAEDDVVIRPRAEVKPVVAERPAAPRTAVPIATSSSTGEETDLVRDTGKKAKRAVPSAAGGLTFLRVAALIVGCAVLGGVSGALTAPKPKLANTPRARAEIQFGDGNKFYEEGRFDDALGKFRGALSIDPTFALAHRAKGAALAKLQRFDEAGEAYGDYLKLEPSAVDATDVKNAITRRLGEKKP